MSAAELVGNLRSRGVEFYPVADGHIRVVGTELLTDDELAILRERKPELLTYLETEDLREFAQERAAIMEHDGGLLHGTAEALALQRTVVRFQLRGTEGGGTYLANECGSFEEAVERLRALYGERLRHLSQPRPFAA